MGGGILQLHAFLSPSMNMCRLIKLTSPNLNYIIGAGAILLYLGIYVMAIPSTDPTAVTVLCNVSTQDRVT